MVDAVKVKLKQMDVRLLAEDTGGNYGRTVELTWKWYLLH